MMWLVQALATLEWLVPPLVQVLTTLVWWLLPESVQVLASPMWLELMSGPVLATLVWWYQPPLFLESVQVSAKLLWLGLMLEPVLAKDLWLVPLLGLVSVPPPHNTRPHIGKSCHMMYLLEEISYRADTWTFPFWC